MFICSSLIFLILFLGGYLRKRESLMKVGRLALIFTGCLEAGLYLILLGVFGGAALSDMQTPAITLMSTIKITGGFLKRADAFMFGIWFFTLYALLNSAVFYAEMLLNGLYHAKKDRHCGKSGSGRRCLQQFLVWRCYCITRKKIPCCMKNFCGISEHHFWCLSR